MRQGMKQGAWLALLVALGGAAGLGHRQYVRARRDEMPEWMRDERPWVDRSRCIERHESVADDAVTTFGKVADLLRGLDRRYTTELASTRALPMVEHGAMGTRTLIEISLRRVGQPPRHPGALIVHRADRPPGP